MTSPEKVFGPPELPQEIRDKLKRMERRTPTDVGLAAIFVVSLLGMMVSVLSDHGDFHATLRLPGPVVFGAMSLLTLVGWIVQEKSKRSRILEFQSLAEMLHRHACTELALRDAVSGAYNRVALREFAGRLIDAASRKEKPLALALMVLENFEELKRACGPSGAALALAEFARVLQAATRGSDVVARYEGEKFVVVLAEATTLGAELVFLRVKQRLAAAGGVRLYDESVPLEFASGAAVYRRGMDWNALLQEADSDLLRRRIAGDTAVKAASTA